MDGWAWCWRFMSDWEGSLGLFDAAMYVCMYVENIICDG